MADRRIVTAEIFWIKAALASPYRLTSSYGTITHAQAVLLKLTSADGIVGWGEADPLQPFTEEGPDEVIDVLFKELLPAVLEITNPEPGSIDFLLDDLLGGHLLAKGAVTMALLDLEGRRLGVPVTTLLGGAIRSSVPVLWPIGAGTAEEDVVVIDQKAALGFSTFMLKMGAAPVADEIRRIVLLKERYGDRFKIIADANQGWTKDEAETFLAGVQDRHLLFVEQPISKDDAEGMAMLAQGTPIPISADESLTGLKDAARLARLGAASVFSIKSSKNGGPLRAQQIATVARAFGIKCYMNSMLEFGVTQAASLHHAATMPNLMGDSVGHAFMSTLRMMEDPTNFSSFIREGVAYVPNGPGLGVNVDEEHVRRLAVVCHCLSG